MKITLSHSGIRLGASVAICGAALAFIRLVSGYFAPGTTTADHPVFALVTALLLGSAAWLMMAGPVKKWADEGYKTVGFLLLIFIGLALRLVFWDSVPIYEDDWRRYLWDGAVVFHGLDPYLFSPEQIHASAQSGAASVPELAQRAILSRDADHFAGTINNPDLTTIYPPLAQISFALAHWIDPFDLDGLRTVFLFADALGFWVMIRTLIVFDRSPVWAILYWLNPILIFTVYSGGHMDVLLVGPLMAALLFAARRPIVAGAALAVAVGIKLWPLLLAPVLFRHLRTSWVKLGLLVIWVGGLSLVFLLPLLLQLGPGSGLSAYSTDWTNSSFLFPLFRAGLSGFAPDADLAARILAGAALMVISLWLGLVARDDPKTVPYHLLLICAALLWLSPTGYPWYLIWALVFVPFVPRVWALALFLGAASYYARFWLGETGQGWLYSSVLVPLWYGIPLALFFWRDIYVRHILRSDQR